MPFSRNTSRYRNNNYSSVNNETTLDETTLDETTLDETTLDETTINKTTIDKIYNEILDLIYKNDIVLANELFSDIDSDEFKSEVLKKLKNKVSTLYGSRIRNIVNTFIKDNSITQ